MLPPRRPKFQHKYSTHIVLFLLTLFTTTFTTAWLALLSGLNPLPLFFMWPVILHGLSYSIPLLIILSAHEFGHYFACRYYNLDATLPYYLPAPLPLSGTLGAVIRIREAFPSKRALFDIGVAGPIGGFIALLPFLYWGMTLSAVFQKTDDSFGIYLGEPLLWQLVEWLHFGVVPESMDVSAHPMALAAWWGMLATALNLLPFGQLDGGHIMYASVGRHAAVVSLLTLFGVSALALQTNSWMLTATLMAVMALLFGFRHPRINDEHEPLDRPRQLVAIAALIIFIICFTPVPIEILGD
jgi:membrane-associated protease RseP (regulator of RpoE activity)